jgi:hypothetical protein
MGMTDEEGKIESENSKPKVRIIAPIEGLETKAQIAPSQITASSSRTCAYHPSMSAVYICAQCQKPLCASCASPYGQLFICSQCYQPPATQAASQRVSKPLEKPPLESVLGLFGGLLIIVGFFLPWATSDFTLPSNNDSTDIFTGFTIVGDYPEVIMVLTMGILILVVEFILIILATSPNMLTKPPIGIWLVPLLLAFIAFLIMVEFIIRAEGFVNNISVGWFICLIGTVISMWPGIVSIKKIYAGENE